MDRDINSINKILDKFNEFYSSNDLVVNLNIIRSIYEERRIVLKNNIEFVENIENPFKENWIIDGPIINQVNEKFFKIAKIILPVILSLIIYLSYVLMRLSLEEK